MPPKTALTYERKSQKEQSNWSTGGQRRINCEYAAKRGLEVLGSYLDDGNTGTNFDRPGWQALVRAIRRQRPDYVVVTRYNRLVRKAGLGLATIEALEDKFGVVFLSAEEMAFVDIYSPWFYKMRADLLVNADFEGRVIRGQIHFGQWSAQMEGRFVHVQPFGYVKGTDHRGKPLMQKSGQHDRLFEYLRWAHFEAGLRDAEIRAHAETLGFTPTGKSALARIWSNCLYYGMVRVKAYKDNPSKLVEGAHAGYFPRSLWPGDAPMAEPRAAVDDPALYLRGLAYHEGCGQDKPLSGGYSTGRGGRRYAHYKCNACNASVGRTEQHHEALEAELRSYAFDQQQLDLLRRMTEEELAELTKARREQRTRIAADIETLKRRMLATDRKYLETASISEERYLDVSAVQRRDLEGLQIKLRELNDTDLDERAELTRVFDGLHNLYQPFAGMTVPHRRAYLTELFGEIHLTKTGYRTARKPRLFGCNSLSLKGLDPLGKAGRGLNLPPPPACTAGGNRTHTPEGTGF